MKRFSPAAVFSLLLLFFPTTRAQEPCPLAGNTSAVLLNLRLGETAAEVSAKLGKNLGIKTNKKDDYRFFQNYISRKPPAALNGVRAIYLRFLAKKLYQLEIFYEEKKYPSDLKNFSMIVSAELNLPVEQWKIVHRQAVFACGDLSLEIDYQLNPRIELTDEKVRRQVEEINKKKPLF